MWTVRFSTTFWTSTARGRINSSAVARAALRLGPPTMLVTSAHAMMAGSIGNLLVTAREAVLAEHRAVPDAPHGTGDLISALFLGRLLGGQGEGKALQAATAAVFEVLARAVKRGADELMLETDAQSLVHPMAMVQVRRLVHPADAPSGGPHGGPAGGPEGGRRA